MGAASYFEQALAIEPDYVDALIGLARAYWDMAKTDLHVPGSETHDYLEKSNGAWNRARELDPDHPAIVALDGWEATQRGDYTAAARSLEKAISRDATNADVVRSGDDLYSGDQARQSRCQAWRSGS